jgi:hypothetical protein
MVDIEKRFKEMLDEYSADRVAKADFAAASVGGHILEVSSHIPLNKETVILFTNDEKAIGTYDVIL